MKKLTLGILGMLLLGSCGQQVLPDAPVSGEVDTGSVTNKSFASKLQSLNNNEIEDLIRSFDSWRAEHPEATSEELNSEIDRLINSRVSGKLSVQVFGDVGPRVQAICDRSWTDKYNCSKTWAYQNDAVNFAAAYTSGSNGGFNDAARHAHWNASMVRGISLSWAQEVSKAYEDDEPNYTQTDWLLEQMDFYNNRMGWEIGLSSYDINYLVRVYMSDGGLRLMNSTCTGLVPSNSSNVFRGSSCV